MLRYLLPLLAVASACTTLDQTSLAVSENDGIVIDLPQGDPCNALPAGATATINGQSLAFTERGGGECSDVPTGGSILTFWPSSKSGPQTTRFCNCRQPKLAYREDPTVPLEVSICDGANCIRASWPVVPPPRRLIAPERASGTFRVTLDPPTHTMSVSVRQGGAEPRLVRAQGYLDVTPIDSKPVVVSLLEQTEVSASSCAAASCGSRGLLQTSTVTVLIEP